VHGPVEFERPEALRLGEKVRHAAFAVAISSFGRAQLCRWSHFTDWPKLHVVRCGVDGEMLRAPSPTPSAPRLVCVARFSEAKGHMLLLEAAERLAAEGLAFEIVLAGDGPLRPAVEEEVKAKGLQGHVRLAGWMSSAQVRDAIVSSRAMVLPSFAEGLPVVFMEAFALGRPVIASSIAGIPELVEAGVSGWLIPAGSVDALVASMRSALQATPEQLDAMGRAGAARVASDHDARKEARKLLALFRASIASAMGPAVSTRPPSASLR
jgi:glycosyltransferase involved in cell wall biosynthesis